MRNAKLLIPIITILAALIGAGLMYLALSMGDEETTTTATTRGTTTRDVSNINSFEECAAAGFPIQETFPERCVADGKSFTRSVTPTATTPTTPTIATRPEFEQLSPTLKMKSPQTGDAVSSPLVVEGQAAGWYFEAEFPVRLEDANGNVLAQAPARAQGDWMTAEFVAFKVTLTFAQPATATGKLILEKSNPRGEGAVESVEIVVKF